jgi:hypothetical protein
MNMLLIHHGDTQWEELSEDEQRHVPAEYQAINSTIAGSTPSCAATRSTSARADSWLGQPSK